MFATVICMIMSATNSNAGNRLSLDDQVPVAKEELNNFQISHSFTTNCNLFMNPTMTRPTMRTMGGAATGTAICDKVYDCERAIKLDQSAFTQFKNATQCNNVHRPYQSLTSTCVLCLLQAGVSQPKIKQADANSA